MLSTKMKFSIFTLHYLLWLTLGFPDHNNDSTTKYDADANDDRVLELEYLNIVCFYDTV